ncbi:DEAD/DEAH box helicase [Intestinimonas massiliensis]|mgnify:FL=1|jgi:putative helicase|uniref:DEAD/DEAH box helicase n=1 Tax=Intestinimonas massiliensis (ex Afouda et al. 2020) TaxID=1673721 RepID=A0ABS9MCB6_9FIRM|nr:DEAD/DEAH box helicase [Intestinimonas massiliensis (ex Afouda et al. 2020)]MCG4528160.1 DEAD/DEAH box helicase [Intestinimonas massiliensis (ex Afouda et al. 2020)]MCQ4806769.1 DEAD/DEAH box helicase [Intestinimonas massiliensis (ex Afouda et al. 2020)]
MDIRIDYLTYTEQVNISNDSTDKAAWKSLYSFICDYLPMSVVSYSDWSITFPWRYFLSIKGFVGQYLSARHNQYRVVFTDNAKSMLKAANDTSYNTALALNARSEAEIKARLESIGFKRSLTINQLNNLKKISHLPGAATFSVPGAGKTTEALAFFFVNATDIDRLLVVAPKNAFSAWDEQLDACMGENYGKFVRLRGGEAAIQIALRTNPRFMLITYDQLSRVKNTIVSLLSSGNIYMFLDESHRIKGGKQIKRADAILEMAHLPKRKLIMSGTPMPQSPKDLISQFSFLYPTKDVTDTTVIDLIQPIFVRTTKGQLGIPKLDHRVVQVPMTQLQREIYKTLKSEVRRQLNPVLSDSSRYELRRIGKCVMKVMEFVSNPSLLSNDMDYAFDRRVGALLLESDGPKIDYVCRRARQLAAEGKKVLIWSSFVQNVELIALRLSDLGAEYIHGGVDAGDESDFDTREGKIKRFHTEDTCKVLVANPAACSEGISLHKVCQYAIYLDRSFNAAHYMQSEDRIHRLGLSPDAKPQIEFVECEDSIDQVVRTRLELKVKTMAQALEDSSLSVEISSVDYDEEAEDYDSLTADDAKAVIEYFFSGDQND